MVTAFFPLNATLCQWWWAQDRDAYTHLFLLRFSSLVIILVILAILFITITTTVVLCDRKVDHWRLHLHGLSDQKCIFLWSGEGYAWFCNDTRDVEKNSIVVKIDCFRVQRQWDLLEELRFECIPFFIASLLHSMGLGNAFRGRFLYLGCRQDAE